MDYTNLGRTGLKVSRLCLGTMNFGHRTPEAEAFRIMDRALELGVNFFDTANVYTRPAPRGTTETIVGNWFAQGDGRREKVVLATKLYGEMDPWPNNARYGALAIRKACEASLKRMQTDYIDLYQMHHIDRAITWDEAWQAFEQLFTSGKIVYSGSSNFAGWHVAAACEAAKRRNYLGLVSEQSLYNLLDRTIELEVIPACQHYGLGLLPWSPLGGGLLGGILEASGDGRRTSPGVQQRLDEARPQIQAYESLCKEIGVAPGVLALAWLLRQPAVTAPIVGPRTVEQLDEAVSALTIVIEDETLKRLDEIFPGPGGAAPEAYAW
ncbi:MAG: aldo/keto reductase [Bacteroidota bacterium]|nr:aldo/keto reductase [Bacteroidota bacterium]MDP4233056.1 aldo/keto reductase [Bacteroidota bacterium]MDP4241799.1 aldo/keto reductase [Bacteroidota bacterium]MDP4288780.1 aldo/keto reductase [Bacteroidota bacterium]